MTTRSAPLVGVLAATAEDLCLSFANTRYWRGTEAPTEELRAPEDLLRWCGGTAGVDVATAAARFAADPAAGTAALSAALALREAFYALFAGAAEDATPAQADVATLAEMLAEAPGRSRLVCGPAGFGWAVPADGSLAALLAPVLWSAGDLLTGRRLARVRRCANPECGWLFLDDSKAATRRWCMMSACGNRAKAKRHYAKLKAAR
jgi:predicted RNA-binding Zn ribbon-like protein